MHAALIAISKEKWAITQDALQTLCEVARREGDAQKIPPQESKSPFNGPAHVISVRGPMFRYANVFTEVSGATSYEMLSKELDKLAADESVHHIVLDIDSPGGEVNGCIELAEKIRRVKAQKPVTAYISGMGASAAYWLAAAASKIYASPTAIIGSIGVQSVIPKREGDDLVFVSSASPNKNLDPGTEDGAAECQRICDDLAEVFIDSVALGRGVTAETVKESFGKGGVFVAADALSRHMIDSVSTFEDMPMSNEEASDLLSVGAIQKDPPEIYQAIILEGRRLEQERLSAIDALALPGMEAEMAALKKDLSVTPEAAAVQIIKAQKARRSSYLEDLESAESSLSALTSNPLDEEATALDSLDQDLEKAMKMGVI